MRYSLFEQQKDSLLLAARVLLVVLFVFFGWEKMTGFSGTVSYMASTGIPTLTLAALIAVIMELVVGVAILLGYFTRPLAMLLALYTLASGLVGHHYWTMAAGAEQYDMMIHFYKNVSITGGLLALAAAGPGKFSIDGR
jgi:putative oxidoreductase